MTRTVYICYFGLHEPLVQTQVLPYLRELRKADVEVTILTFEPEMKSRWSLELIETERSRLAQEGIDWFGLPYHKWPSVPATLYDVICGARFVWRLCRSRRIDIIHARVHTPALMGALAKKFLKRKPQLLFDIRGFFPEEYVDAGIWPKNGVVYRAVKRVERWLFKESDAFVVLTENARLVLFPESAKEGLDRLGRPVEVIPCCVDMTRFESANEVSRETVRRDLGLDDRFVVAYVGAFGGWYLTEETAAFFAALKRRKPEGFALILTQSEPTTIASLLRSFGYGDRDFLITRVAPKDIPKYLSASDAAVSFIKPCYSKRASSPTKNAEYLASGLPVIANDGIGDTTEQIESENVGVIIKDFSRESYEIAVSDLDQLMKASSDLEERCRRAAFAYFDLESVGGNRYRRIYRRLMGERE